MGLNIADMDNLTIGDITDMLTEKGNDGEKYDYVATQEDFDRF